MTALRTPARSRSRRRRDTEPPGRTLAKAALAIVVVAVLVGLALSIYHGVPWVGYKTIYATVPETGDLLPHDPVRIAGVQVGQVSGITLSGSGDARLQLQIDPGTKLPPGTTFALRADGLLGSRLVQLIPGHGTGDLPAGATLHGNRTTLTYGVPDALNVFNTQTRGRLGEMVSGFGEGLLGRGTALNGTIHQIAAESAAAQRLVAGLVGPGQLPQLVPALQSMMAPLDAARSDIAGMLSPASAALQPFVSERGAVQAALDRAPGALDAASAGLSNGERLLDAADALSVQAQAVLPSAPAGLDATTTLLRTSRPALGRARSLLVAARPAVPAALRITSAVSPVLSPLGQALGRATPVSEQVAPYGCNLENFGAVIRSMTGFGGSANVPGGPGGPAMAFRLEVIPAGPQQMFGVKDSTLMKRVGYSRPCAYLSTTYPTSTSPTSGLGGQS
jgi:phospholipid/cholesterol/gamma-HCH transport system substrate-binding protein